MQEKRRACPPCTHDCQEGRACRAKEPPMIRTAVLLALLALMTLVWAFPREAVFAYEDALAAMGVGK